MKLYSFWRLVLRRSFLLTSWCPACTVLPIFLQNKKEMATNLELAKEECKKIITLIAAYQQQVNSNYNKRVKIHQFHPGDLTLRKTFIPAHWEGSKKMAPIWEGPYKISQVGGKGNYTLTTMSDNEIKK